MPYRVQPCKPSVWESCEVVLWEPPSSGRERLLSSTMRASLCSSRCVSDTNRFRFKRPDMPFYFNGCCPGTQPRLEKRTPPSYQDFDDVRGGKSNSLTSLGLSALLRPVLLFHALAASTLVMAYFEKEEVRGVVETQVGVSAKLTIPGSQQFLVHIFYLIPSYLMTTRQTYDFPRYVIVLLFHTPIISHPDRWNP